MANYALLFIQLKAMDLLTASRKGWSSYFNRPYDCHVHGLDLIGGLRHIRAWPVLQKQRPLFSSSPACAWALAHH